MRQPAALPIRTFPCERSPRARSERPLIDAALAHLDAAVATLTDLAGITRIDVGETRTDGNVEGCLGDLLDALPTGACVSDPETGALVRANRAFADLTGYPAANLLGLTPPHPWLETCSSSGLGGETAARVRHRTGRLTPVEIRRLPVRDADGEVRAWVSLVTETGGRPRFEQQLARRGELRSIGDLAHDLNNPLFAILGMAELLLADTEPGSEARERLECIRTSGNEIAEVVRGLSDSARAHPEDRAA